MSIDHVGLFKLLISTFFLEFIELFVPIIAADIDKDSIEFLPEQVLIDITAKEKKIIDLLAKVKYKNQDTFFLVHVEAQSYTQSEFAKRMFIYFSSLYKLYDLPIYPVVIFSFDEPLREEPKVHTVTFPGLDVLRFEFTAIQLNRMNWRQYLTQQNPVAAALMAKMNIPLAERPQVKAECLRLLTTLRLDPARMEFISGFIDTYLNLNETEEKAFQAAISTMGLEEREEYMKIVTSWQRKGRQEALEEVALNSLREGLSVEAVVRITGLPLEKVQQLQAELQTTD